MSDYVELSNLTKIYPTPKGSAVIVQDFNLRIRKGEFVALIGHSGCGKSTVLSMLAGLNDISGGGIVLAGKELAGAGPDRGVVFQSPSLLPWLTAYENVAVPMEIRGTPNPGARARQLLEEVGLTGRAHHYPSQLSGGEQQRVALARALANDPPILLADEPTGNLDTKNGHLIMDLLKTIHQSRNTTLILVTHDQELAAMADVRISLRDGRVV